MNSNDLSKQNNLTDNEVVVLEAILQRMNNGVYKIPIREVAKEAFVSTTSVVRLAKKMGYDGYSEMLYELKLQCTSAVEYHVSDMTLSVLTRKLLYGKSSEECGKIGILRNFLVFRWCLNLLDNIKQNN